jgi:hypothetical protein
MCGIYEHALDAAWAGGQTVELDLSRVTGWSEVAQAIVVRLAHELAKRDSRLLLSGASLRLRIQSRRVDVFNKVREPGR